MGDLFLSHSTKDKEVALQLAADLKAAGHRVFVDSDHVDGIKPSSDWRAALFQELRLAHAVVFLNSKNSQGSMWCHTELALAVERIPIYAVDAEAGIGPHSLLTASQSIRLETDMAASTKWLIDSLAQLFNGTNQQFHWDHSRSPYPGLRSFEADDAGAFFGRSAEIAALLERVDPLITSADSDVITVIGPSGCGKSSLIKAGVLPRLRDRSDWIVVGSLEPGPFPTDSLAAALTRAAGQSLPTDFGSSTLRKKGLAAVAAEMLGHDPDKRRVLIAIDQYEYLRSTPAAERTTFLKLLADSLATQSRITLLLTARQDRLDDITTFPQMGSFVAKPILIRPIDREGLAEAIEAPAVLVDMTIGPGLTAELIEDAAEGSGDNVGNSLPLLACTLQQLYLLAVQTPKRQMTLAQYEAVGKVAGAIRTSAKQAEDRLGPVDSAVLDSLLVDLVSLDDDRSAVARPVSPASLSPEKQTLLTRLIDEHLVTGDDQSARLIHDGLIANWPRLADVVKTERDHLLARSRLERRAADWSKDPADDRLLGPEGTEEALGMVAPFMAVQEGDAAQPEPDLVRFVRASQQRNLRRRQRVQGVVTVIAALAVVASLLALVSTRRNAELQARSRVENSQRLSLLSSNEVDPEAAALLAIEAVKASPTVNARGRLGETYQNLLQRGWQLGGYGDRVVEDAAFSPDSTTLASGASAGDPVQIRVWDVATKQRLADIAGPPTFGRIVWTSDGASVLRSFVAGGVGLWDVASGTLRHRFETPGWLISYAPSQGLLATVDDLGDVTIWDVQRSLGEPDEPDAAPTNKVLRSGFAPARWNDAGHRITPYPFAWSPDGRQIATPSATVGEVTLWDVATGTIVRTDTAGRSPVISLSWSGNGDVLAVGTEQRLQTDNHADGGEALVITRTWARVQVGSWSPDGRYFMSIGDDGRSTLFKPTEDLRTPVEYGLGRRDTGRVCVTGTSRATYVTPTKAVPACTDIAFRGTSSDLGSGITGGAWSPDGSRFATGVPSGINISNADLGATWTLPAVTLTEGMDRHLSWSPDGRYLVATVSVRQGSAPATQGTVPIQLWDVSSLTSLSGRVPLRVNDRNVAGIWSADSSVFMTSTGRELVFTGQGPTRLPVPSEYEAPVLSADGSRLALLSDRGELEIWDTVSHRRTVVPLEDPSPPLSWSRDGRRLLLGAQGWTVVEVATGKVLKRVDDVGGMTWIAGWSADERFVAGAENDELVVFDISGPSPRRVATPASLLDHGGIRDVGWSKDLRHPALAIVDGDGKLSVWEPGSLRQVRRYPAEAYGTIDGVSWGGDSTTLYTVGATGVVWWHLPSGATTLLRDGDGRPAEVSPDGRTLASGQASGQESGGSTVILAPCFTCLPVDDLVTLVRQRLTRSLTAEERSLARVGPGPSSCLIRDSVDGPIFVNKTETFTNGGGFRFRVADDCSVSGALATSPALRQVPPPPSRASRTCPYEDPTEGYLVTVRKGSFVSDSTGSRYFVDEQCGVTQAPPSATPTAAVS